MSYERQPDEEAIAKQAAMDERARKKARRWKRLKWFLAGSATLWILGAIALTIFFRSYLNPIVKSQIEEKGSAALGAPLEIDRVAVGLFPVPNVKLFKVRFAVPKQNLAGTANEVYVGLGASLLQLISSGNLGVVKIELSEPRIKLELPATAHESASNAMTDAEAEAAPPLLPQFRVSQNLGLKLAIHEGQIQVVKPSATDLQLERVQFKLDMPDVNKVAGQISLRTNATAKQNELNFRFPVDVSSAFVVDGNVVTIKDAKGDFFGFAFTANGWQNIASGRAEWKLTGHIPELAAVPVPPSFLPPGKWSGKLSASVVAAAISRTKGWTAHAQLDASQIKGTTKIDHNGLVAEGSLAANASFDVTVDPRPAGTPKEYDVRLNKGYLAADMTEMSIDKLKSFKKPKGIPLVFYFSGAGDQKSVKIEKFDLKFANLAMRSSGVASLTPGSQSALTAVVDRTDLAGWEAYLPPLANSPVKGSLQMNAEVRGDLQKPETLTVKLNPLLLEKFEAGLNWSSDDKETTLGGPVKANARVEMTAVGTELRGALVKLDADLTGVQIGIKDAFNKKSGLPLTLNLQGAQRGQQIEIQSSAIRLGTSAFNMSGRFSNPQRPVLNLKLLAPSANLAELASLSPKTSGVAVAGTAQANLDLTGAYDFKLGIKDSPLRLKGNLGVKIPTYKIARTEAKPTPPPTKNQPAAAPPQPLLPDLVIAKTAQINSDVNIGDLVYGDEHIRGLQLAANLNNSELTGTASIQSIFGGGVKVPRFRTRLSTAWPDSMADFEFVNINMQSAAGFASAEWKDLIKGSASGRMRAQVPHPSNPAFIDRLHSWGTISIRNGFLSTVQIDKLINEKLASVPGLGNQPLVNSKGVTADITSDFNAEKKVLNLAKFVFLTPEKNELRAQGSIGFDKSISLIGTGYLATAPVGGSVRSANSDAQGRLIVPLKIQGNLMKPEISFAEETVRQLLAKTAEKELKKGVEKKLDQLKESVKQKGLEGLKDLFK